MYNRLSQKGQIIMNKNLLCALEENCNYQEQDPRTSH